MSTSYVGTFTPYVKYENVGEEIYIKASGEPVKLIGVGRYSAVTPIYSRHKNNCRKI